MIVNISTHHGVNRFENVFQVNEYNKDEIRIYQSHQPNTPTFIRKDTILLIAIGF